MITPWDECWLEATDSLTVAVRFRPNAAPRWTRGDRIHTRVSQWRADRRVATHLQRSDLPSAAMLLQRDTDRCHRDKVRKSMALRRSEVWTTISQRRKIALDGRELYGRR